MSAVAGILDRSPGWVTGRYARFVELRDAGLDWLRRHPTLVDTVIAGVLCFAALGRLFQPQVQGWLDFRTADALGFALVAASTAPLAVRRRWPVTVLLATGAATIALSALHYSSGGTAMLVALYTVAAHRSRGESGRYFAVTLLASGAALSLSPDEAPTGALVENAAFFTAAFALGRSQRTRRAYIAEVEARAERAERDREIEAEAAVNRERRAIARELHDVVAHNVSVIAVQATGARRCLRVQVDMADEALRTIESTSREALTEMRRLLGVLRTDGEADGELTPQPGTHQLPALIDQVRDSGLPVELAVEGTPRQLSAGLDLTVYRIAQESLTNALKYAGPASARVLLRYQPAAVEIEVADDGRGAHPDPDHTPGFGLVGMRERVALFDGEVEAGPGDDGGFRVRARIPLPREEFQHR